MRSTRRSATAEVIERINQKLSPGLKAELDKFVVTPEAGSPSELQRYLSAAPVASSRTLQEILARITRLREIGIEALDWSDVNANRMRGLANQARRLRPRDLRIGRSTSARGYAIITCGLADALMQLNDDAIEMHDQLMLRLRSKAKEAQEADLLANRDVMLRLIGLLHSIFGIVLHPRRLLRAIGGAIFRLFRKGFLRRAFAECAAILEPARHDGLSYLRGRWNSLRRFGPHFLATMIFEHTDAGASTAEAIQFLREVDSGIRFFTEPPTHWLSKKRRKLIMKPNATVDRAIWEILLHERIVRDLRSGDLWVKHSREYLPLARDLVVPEAEKQRFFKAFPHMKSAETFLAFLREGYGNVLAEAEKCCPNQIPARSIRVCPSLT